ENILSEPAGRLVLGDAGERRYGRRNFLELYAAFQVPQALRVLCGNQAIGTSDALVAESGEAAELSCVLGARAWRAVDIRWKDGFVVVEPIEGNQLPRWQGSPQLLSGELCQAMREILVSGENPAIWSSRARDKMAAIRAEYGFLDP